MYGTSSRRRRPTAACRIYSRPSARAIEWLRQCLLGSHSCFFSRISLAKLVFGLGTRATVPRPPRVPTDAPPPDLRGARRVLLLPPTRGVVLARVVLLLYCPPRGCPGRPGTPLFVAGSAAAFRAASIHAIQITVCMLSFANAFGPCADCKLQPPTVMRKCLLSVATPIEVAGSESNTKPDVAPRPR